jgi:hypothetical protein
MIMNDKKPSLFDLSYYEYKCKDSIDAIEDFLSNIEVNKIKLFELEPSLEYSYSQIENKISTFGRRTIVDVVTKVDWLFDNSVQWRGFLNNDYLHVLDELSVENKLFGKRLSQLIKFYKLSPFESIGISWSEIFAISAIQQCALLFKYHFSCDEVDRLSLQHLGLTPTSLSLDIADCIAKSVVFNQLLDEGWADSYKSRKAAFAKAKKNLPLKKEVLVRYNDRYRDTDKSSAGLAILLELQQENSELLDLLLKNSKKERTFTTWIKESEEEPDISTFF